MSPATPAGTIATRLAALAAASDSRWSITFLDSHGAVFERCGAAELATRAAAVAGFLERQSAPGAPVLLVFQPCIDFLVAFLACQWSGRLAVPINPPRRHRLIQRLQAVAADSGAALALTGGGVAEQSALWQADSAVLGAIRWQDVADIDSDPALATPLRDIDPAATCFIQYTSGSTSLPKGVEVSHANLMADMARMEAAWGLSPSSMMVTWLPAFHDLGLIFGLLQTLFSGCPVVQMAPNSFLQRPALWLEAISRFRGTHTAAPSFAYDLCTRRIAPEQRAGLNLSCLVMAMNAAEPISPQVMDNFIDAFGANGFRRDTFAPAYGLAESTLAVTASPVGVAPKLFTLDAAALEDGRINADSAATRRTVIAGSGTPLADVSIAIVDPVTGRRQPPHSVGEIWVGGPTIARGYWRRPEESAAAFGVHIASDDDRIGYLRTGDLGAMIEGDLCVTGRIKDLIILAGANHYPQDIERTAQAAHPALRVDGGAAFGIAGDDGTEQVVLVQELARTQRRGDPAPVFSAISTSVWQTLELQLSRIVLVEPGAVLRTSSGKIQRSANRQAWREGTLAVIAEWRAARDQMREPTSGTAGSPPPGDALALDRWLREWLSQRLELPLSDVPVDRGVGELGLTSVDAVDLACALGAHVGRQLPQTFAFDHPTIRAMVAYLGGSAPAIAVASPTPPLVPGSGTNLEQLLSILEEHGRG